MGGAAVLLSTSGVTYASPRTRRMSPLGFNAFRRREQAHRSPPVAVSKTDNSAPALFYTSCAILDMDVRSIFSINIIPSHSDNFFSRDYGIDISPQIITGRKSACSMSFY